MGVGVRVGEVVKEKMGGWGGFGVGWDFVIEEVRGKRVGMVVGVRE